MGNSHAKNRLCNMLYLLKVFVLYVYYNKKIMQKKLERFFAIFAQKGPQKITVFLR
jgi:hypothetical protein